MRTDLTFGRLLRTIRERMRLTIVVMAERIDSDESRVAKLEHDRAVCTVEERDAYKSLVLTQWEREQIERLFVASPMERDHVACKNCSSHDGEQRPGGKLGFVRDGKVIMGDRDELCDNIDHCLNEFIQRWPTAQRSHCPPKCTKRAHSERELLVSIGSSANVGG